MTPAMRRWIRPPYIVAAILIGLAIGVAIGVATQSGSSRPASAPSTTVHVPQPAGPTPSASAQMVCAEEAQKDLASTLGISATAVSTPTWVDHTYACDYTYPAGSVALSVKELTSRVTTDQYYDGLRSTLGQAKRLEGFGQGAFTTPDGSLVLRKDYKVLLVDTSRLGVPFGQGFATRAQVATAVAVTVLGCWTGA